VSGAFFVVVRPAGALSCSGGIRLEANPAAAIFDCGQILPHTEAKTSPGPPDRSLLYLAAKFPEAQAVQISATGTADHKTERGIRVCPATTFLITLV